MCHFIVHSLEMVSNFLGQTRDRSYFQGCDNKWQLVTETENMQKICNEMEQQRCVQFFSFIRNLFSADLHIYMFICLNNIVQLTKCTIFLSKQ